MSDPIDTPMPCAIAEIERVARLGLEAAQQGRHEDALAIHRVLACCRWLRNEHLAVAELHESAIRRGRLAAGHYPVLGRPEPRVM